MKCVNIWDYVWLEHVRSDVCDGCILDGVVEFRCYPDTPDEFYCDQCEFKLDEDGNITPTRYRDDSTTNNI